MPGLVALIGKPGQPDLADALARCLAPLTFADYQTGRLVLPELGVALGRTGPARVATPQPGYAAGGQVAALLEGELLDARGLAGRLGLDPATAPAELIAALYERDGEQGLEQLPGHWSVAIADRRNARLVIANDCFGMRPLFRAQSADGTVLVASHPAAILAHPAAPHEANPAAIIDYLAFGFPWGGKTLFRGVEILPPATLLVFADGRAMTTRYWVPIPAPKETLDEADLEAVRRSFNESVCRMAAADRPFSLALTGGSDSRAILSALVVAGVRPHTVIHSVPDGTDAQLSAELARRSGATHHFFEVRGEDLPALVQPGVQLLGGQVSGLDVHPLRFLDQFTSFTHVMLTGMGADILKRDHYASGLATGSEMHADAIRQAVKHYSPFEHIETDLPALLSPECLAELGDQPARTIREAFQAVHPDVPPAERGGSVFLDQWVARCWIKGDLIVRRELETRHPFLDRQTVMLAWNLPAWARQQYLPHRYIITVNAPALARVPYDHTGEPLIYPGTAVERWRETLRTFRRRAKRKLGIRYVRRPSYHLAEWIRGPLRPLFYDVLLDPRTRGRPYFRSETVERWLAEHMAGGDYSIKLAALLSLELTLRWALDREGAS